MGHLALVGLADDGLEIPCSAVRAGDARLASDAVHVAWAGLADVAPVGPCLGQGFEAEDVAGLLLPRSASTVKHLAAGLAGALVDDPNPRVASLARSRVVDEDTAAFPWSLYSL